MKSLQVYICEKSERYKEQFSFVLSLANCIEQELKNNPNETGFTFDKSDLEDNGFKFMFFETIKIIHANENKYNTYYTKYNKDKKIFDTIGININFKTNNTYYKIAKVLSHELTHAYEDFNRHINNRETLKDFYNRKEEDFGQNTFNYKKTLKPDFEVFRTILNNISKIEQNAYLSELEVELETSNFDIFKYKTFDESRKAALKIIFNNKNSAYKIYLDALDIISNLSKTDKENLKNVYNDINKSNFDANTVYKKVYNVLDKILTKIEKIILEIFTKYYNKRMEQK
jgi:hypothetical protein